jgi:hypothetical protein
VAKVRTDNWAERSAYRAGMIDAGYTLLADGTFLMDAGPKPAPVEPAIDAGLPELDAGRPAEPPVADAGAVEVVKPKVPPTAAEQGVLDSLSKLAKQEKWDAIFEARGSLRTSLKTPSAREQGLALLVDATCGRNDNVSLMPIVNEYKTVATAAQLRATRQRCIKLYPSAEFLVW